MKPNPKLSTLFFSILLASFLVSFASAQNVKFSPQSIIINPIPSFSVYVFVDRDTSGNNSPSYNIGESIRLGVSPSEDSYVYLFNVRSNGAITLILPNRYDADGANNYIRANQTKYFPPQRAGYTFTVDGPTGLDKVIAVASKQPLNVATLASFTNGSGFAESKLGESGFASTLSIIIEPLPQETWVTDTAQFYVNHRSAVTPQTIQPVAQPIYVPTPSYGTLEIRSYPSGASAFVDGQFVGTTPLRYDTSTGNHSVSIVLDGHRSFDTYVTLQHGENYVINTNLAYNAYPQPVPVVHAPVVHVPVVKNDCRHGGWRFVFNAGGFSFSSQGDCIRYVNHH